jgi:ubiquinone/menaquinone biosynthesis C-methylase UbiE
MSRHQDEHLRELRREAAGGLFERVLEAGVGAGANWDFLPAGVSYVGIEPDDYMRRRAETNASERDGDITVVDAAAEALPFDDQSFDSVLVTLTLCSVADPAKALAEMYRVVKPGGSLRYLEHVRPAGARGCVLDVAVPLWSRIFGGCHPNRRTAETIRAAGFVIEEQREARISGLPGIAGVARKLKE